MTDPLDHCPMICGVHLVCGTEPHCVLNKKPDCECDWARGVCIENEDVEDELVITMDDRDDSVIDVTIQDADGDEEDKVVVNEEDHYEHAKVRWGLHSVGVAALMSAAVLTMLGVVVMFVKLVVTLNRPAKAPKFLLDDSESGSSSEERAKSRHLDFLPGPIREARRKRRMKRRTNERGNDYAAESAIMSEVSLGNEGYVSACLVNSD